MSSTKRRTQSETKQGQKGTQKMTDIKALARRDAAPLALSGLDEYQRFAKLLVAAGVCKGEKEGPEVALAKAVLKIQYGAEVGLHPIQAISGCYVVHGSVGMGATTIAGLIKRSGKYRYEVRAHNDKGCSIEFFELVGDAWVSCGPESVFTVEDAKAAGLTNNQSWTKYPRNMVFARAMTNGARWYCSDVFGGPVYTPDELGDDTVTVEGEVIDG